MGERILGDLPVLKFNTVGEVVKGKLVLLNEAKKFKDSYSLTLDDNGNKFIIFVSNIVRDKLVQNGIEIGATLKLTFKGKIKSKSSAYSYNDIEIAVLD